MLSSLILYHQQACEFGTDGLGMLKQRQRMDADRWVSVTEQTATVGCQEVAVQFYLVGGSVRTVFGRSAPSFAGFQHSKSVSGVFSDLNSGSRAC